MTRCTAQEQRLCELDETNSVSYYVVKNYLLWIVFTRLSLLYSVVLTITNEVMLTATAMT